MVLLFVFFLLLLFFVIRVARISKSFNKLLVPFLLCGCKRVVKFIMIVF